MATVLVQNFDPSILEFNYKTSKDVATGATRKTVYINPGAGQHGDVHLQLCRMNPSDFMRMPFNPSLGLNGNESQNRYSIEVAVTDSTVPERIDGLDNAILDYVHRESVKIFGKQLERSTLKDRLVSAYRPAQDESKSNLLRLKLSADRVGLDEHSRPINVAVFRGWSGGAAGQGNMELEKLTEKGNSKALHDVLTRGCRLCPIVKIGSLWFSGGDKSFGYTLEITGVVIDPGRSATTTSIAQSFITDGVVLNVVSPKRKLAEDEADAAAAPQAKKQCGGEDAPVGTISIDATLEAQAVNPEAYL